MCDATVQFTPGVVFLQWVFYPLAAFYPDHVGLQWQMHFCSVSRLVSVSIRSMQCDVGEKMLPMHTAMLFRLV